MKFVITIVFVFVFMAMQAQEAVVSAGGIADENGGSVSLSRGQVVYQCNNGLGGPGVEGVRQAHDASDAAAIDL